MGQHAWHIWGVAELSCWVLHRPDYWPTGRDAEDCIDAHLACGITHLAWDLGRSVLSYHSDLRDATCDGVGAHYAEHYPAAPKQVRAVMDEYRRRCQLRVALTYASNADCTIFGRLCMNRHYGPGTRHRSRFAELHPRWNEIDRDGWLDTTRLCYALPEYRAERVAILEEAVQIGCEGVMLDFCRQPPAVRYHPSMVNPYRERTGVDPRTLRLGALGQFLDWFRYRAGFVTDMLRELDNALAPIRVREGREVPVHVRIPNDGLEANLIGGFDLQTWCDEGLVHGIHTSELRWLPGFTAWDDGQYVEIGQRHGIPVYGSSNCLPVQRGGWSGKVNPRGVNPLVLARRALASMEQGMDGISLYQSDTGVCWPGLREALPHFHAREKLDSYINDADVIEGNPVTEDNREFGIDNHSEAREHLEDGAALQNGGHWA